MFFFRLDRLPLFILGAIIASFARPITNWIFRSRPDSFFNKPILREIFYVWTLRAVGICTIVAAYQTSLDSPPRSMMLKDANRLILLEKGKITQGEVVKSFYQKGAPEGWKILYKFYAEHPRTGEKKTYWGDAQGPKQYYAVLSSGDPVTIVYYSLKPKINCEIRYFVNHPVYRATFEEAGKLGLIDRFKDKCEIETYSFIEWYGMQQHR